MPSEIEQLQRELARERQEKAHLIGSMQDMWRDTQEWKGLALKLKSSLDELHARPTAQVLYLSAHQVEAEINQLRASELHLAEVSHA